MAASLTLRGTRGVWMTYGPPKLGTSPPFTGDQTNSCRALSYCKDGSLLAWCNAESIFVVEPASDTVRLEIKRTKVVHIQLSPLGRILAVWSHHTVNPETKQSQPNLLLYDTTTGECIKELRQKKQMNWCPRWTPDEGVCCRSVNNELQFFENNNFDEIKTRLHLQKVSEFELAPCGPPYVISAYVQGAKSLPSFVRCYKYPNLGGPTAAIANKSFFKAERISMIWNRVGTALLVLTSTESSDSSYYGEQNLHFVSIKDDSCFVPLAKNGPIYNVEWNPNPKIQEFCVVYGYMPSKVTLFNMKCESLFDFGTGPRNLCYYNNHGNILCLAGLGNLNGNLEFWDLKQKRLINQMKAQDTTAFQWCPDGEHFVTSTTAPKLRVGNGYMIWHYTGTLLSGEQTPSGQELWEVCWQPIPSGKYPEKTVRYSAVESTIEEQPKAAKVGVYRPPGARGEASSFKLHEFEAPSNAKTTGATKGEPLSGPSKRSQKRSEARKKSKQNKKEAAVGAAESTDAAAEESQPPPPSKQARAPPSKPVADEDDEDNDEDGTCSSADAFKQMKKIKKKLKRIEKLRQEQQEGKDLDERQVELLKGEVSLRQQMQDLKIR